MRRGRARRSPRRAVCRCDPMSTPIRDTARAVSRENRKVNHREWQRDSARQTDRQSMLPTRTYLRVRNLRCVHEATVDRVKLEEIRVLVWSSALRGFGLLRAGDGQQFSRVAPFGVQRRPQIAAYRDGRHVVERSQHDDVTVREANRQHVIPVICARSRRCKNALTLLFMVGRVPG